MSILGSIGAIAAAALPGIGQAVGSIYAANKSAKSAKHNTAMALNWEQQKAQNTIQWTAEDMKKAGINPAVAAGQQNQVGSITPQMPDTSGYAQAGNAFTTAVQLIQQQQKIDSEANLNDANALSAEVDAGLKPRETAIKEMEALTNRRRQEQEAQQINAWTTRVMTLLPGETMQQKQEIFDKALQLGVQAAQAKNEKMEAEANAKILDMTGGMVSLDDIKKIVAAVAGAGVYHTEQKRNRTSAEKIAHENNKEKGRNHRTRTYDKKGKLQSETYYEWAD